MGKIPNDEAPKKEIEEDTIKKEAVSWNDKMDAAFIAAMLKEQNEGNRPNGTFTSRAYNNIVKELSDKFNMPIEKKNLMNRIKTLKKYFNQFHDVFKGVALSGYSWNETTRLIEAEDDVWEQLKTAKPDVYKLKTTPVNCYDEMYALWARDRATCTCSYTAKEKKNKLINDQQAETVEEVDHLIENNVINLDNIETTDDIFVASPTPQSDGKQSKSKKRKIVEEDPSNNDKIAISLDNIVHALDRNYKVLENSRPHVYTEGEIYEQLQLMDLEDEEMHVAYNFLLENPVKTRGMFGCPFAQRSSYLKATMQATMRQAHSRDFDNRG